MSDRTDTMKMDGRTVGCAGHGKVVRLVKRRSAGGEFFGCPHYPTCTTMVDLRRGKFRGPAMSWLPPGKWVECGSPEHWQWWRQEQARRRDRALGVFREFRAGDYFDRESPYDEALDDANPAFDRGLNMVFHGTAYEVYAMLFGEDLISETPDLMEDDDD